MHLTDARGAQAVHIAPEAFAVASVEFADEIQVWQNALPGALKGKLASVRPLFLSMSTLERRRDGDADACVC